MKPRYLKQHIKDNSICPYCGHKGAVYNTSSTGRKPHDYTECRFCIRTWVATWRIVSVELVTLKHA